MLDAKDPLTATETRMMEEPDHTRERRLDALTRNFLKRFAPEELNERIDFEAQLHALVREAYISAQDPFLQAVVKAYHYAPFVPPMPSIKR